MASVVRRHAEPLRGARHGVAVAHPHGVGRGQVVEQHAGPVDIERGRAVLALPVAADLAAERLRHELVAVADAEHRHAELEQPRVDLRRALLVDAQAGRRTG